MATTCGWRAKWTLFCSSPWISGGGSRNRTHRKVPAAALVTVLTRKANRHHNSFYSSNSLRQAPSLAPV